MRLVIAIGRHALLPHREQTDADIRRRDVRAAAEQLAPLAVDHDLVLCHNNGPKVARLLAQELANSGVTAPIAVLLTQSLVDAADRAFTRPSMFVGHRFTEDEARGLARRHGWTVAQDGDRWRRLVATPEPQRVIEQPAIQRLADDRALVICAVSRQATAVHESRLTFVDAVVDRDLSAASIAVGLDADRLVLLTDIDAVRTGFGSFEEQAVSEVPVEFLPWMSFPAESMGPKMAAAGQFVRATGRPAMVGALDHAAAVATGQAGTTVTPATAPARALRAVDLETTAVPSRRSG